MAIVNRLCEYACVSLTAASATNTTIKRVLRLEFPRPLNLSTLPMKPDDLTTSTGAMSTISDTSMALERAASANEGTMLEAQTTVIARDLMQDMRTVQEREGELIIVFASFKVEPRT